MQRLTNHKTHGWESHDATASPKLRLDVAAAEAAKIATPIQSVRL